MPRSRKALRCKQKQMEQKQFQAESKKLMDMMIHSIYTHKEIFLRELISNASDAIDKLYFKSLTDDSVGMNKSDFKITLAVDKDARTLTITDNGIGMTKAEMRSIWARSPTAARSSSRKRTIWQKITRSSGSSVSASIPHSWFPSVLQSSRWHSAKSRRMYGSPRA